MHSKAVLVRAVGKGGEVDMAVQCYAVVEVLFHGEARAGRERGGAFYVGISLACALGALIGRACSPRPLRANGCW